MASASHIYAKFLLSAFEQKIKLYGASPTACKLALLKSTYTPDLTSDEFWSTVSSHEASGAGYTAGGKTLATVALTLTTATAWSTVRVNSTLYAVGAVVRPASANGLLYRCIVAGTSGSSPPSYPTALGISVTDGSVTWTTMGDAILVFNSNSVVWTTVTVSTALYAVVYVLKTAADTSPLVSMLQFPAAQSPSTQVFQVVPNSVTGWWAFTPPS